MKTITLPCLHNNADIENLEYPDNIQIGMYVWDSSKKKPILITDFTSVVLHKSITSTRRRFAKRKEIENFLFNLKNEENEFNTIVKWRAFNYSRVIYNI